MKSKAAQWKPGKKLERIVIQFSWLEKGGSTGKIMCFFFFGEVVVKEIYGTAVKSIFNDLPVTSLRRSCSFPPSSSSGSSIRSSKGGARLEKVALNWRSLNEKWLFRLLRKVHI